MGDPEARAFDAHVILVASDDANDHDGRRRTATPSPVGGDRRASACGPDNEPVAEGVKANGIRLGDLDSGPAQQQREETQ